MSETRASNVLDHLHDEDYGAAFDQRDLNHTGLIFCGGRPRIRLSGRWSFVIDPYQEGLRQGWHRDCHLPLEGRTTPWDADMHHGDTMALPSCWNMASGELRHYEGTLWFGRWLDAWPHQDDERVMLRVGGANYDCKVFLDGAFLGNHVGGSTPFFVELTGRLGSKSYLLLAVDNTRRSDAVPMHHIDWFNYGGLFREIELIRLPKVFVRDLVVHLVPDGRFDQIAVEVRLSDPIDGLADLTIAELGLAEAIAIEAGLGKAVFAARPDLWSPDAPRLYEVEACCGDDRVVDRVGFREIRAEGRRILLNGQDVFLRGVCVHEDDWVHGRVVTDADLRQRFAHVKELGCNFLRLAHYPHHEHVAALADELGFMLWAEIPVYWAIDFANPRTLADADNQLRELILRDCNRASVVVWGVGGENPDTDERLAFMADLVATARALDQTRLVSAACLVDSSARRIDDRLAAELDVVGINQYYGWYEPEIEDLAAIGRNYDGQKPIVITAAGAGAPTGRHGTTGELFTEEHMAAVYVAQLDAIAGIDAVRGFCACVLYDFRSTRHQNSFQRGFSRMGLIDVDKRTRKLAFGVVQQFYQSRQQAASG